jgi:glycine hydroxymethyltransferase
MVDLRPKGVSGKDASEILDKVNITVNKNMIPYDPASPMVTSGIRIGTPALTTRGMKETQMEQVAKLIDAAIVNHTNEAKLAEVKQAVLKLTKEFPLYPNL